MFDGKEVGIQVLRDEEVEQNIDEDYLLLMVKEWDPSTWTISDPKEVFIKKNQTLNDLGTILSKVFPHIETCHLNCTKIASAWNFHRV